MDVASIVRPLDLVALTLTGLAALTVSAIQLLLWRTFDRPRAALWAGVIAASGFLDLVQVAMLSVGSPAGIRFFGGLAIFLATLFAGAMILVVADEQSWLAENSRGAVYGIVAAAAVACAVLLATEPRGGADPLLWLRSPTNPSLRFYYTVIIAAAAAAAVLAAIRLRQAGPMLVALGLLAGIARPRALTELHAVHVGGPIPPGLALLAFALVLLVLGVGIGSVVWVLADEKAAALAAVRRNERRVRMEQLGQMAGSIAKDMKEVLARVNAGVVAVREQGRLVDGQAVALDVVDEAVASGQATAEGLLAFARAESSSQPPIDLAALVREQAIDLQFLLGEQHWLSCDTGQQPLMVRLDPMRVRQVLHNAIHNSRDAAGATNRLNVAIRTYPQRLERARVVGHFTLEPGDWVVLLVSDDGPGFPEAVLERAFEPFVSTKGVAGTGLGLTLVYAIARDAGGAAHASNMYHHRGAVLECWFPASAS